MLPITPFTGILAGAAGKTLLQKIWEIIATEGTKIVVKESCKKIFSNNNPKSKSTDKRIKSENKNKERHKLDHMNSAIKRAPIKSQNSKKKNNKKKKDSEKYKVNI